MDDLGQPNHHLDDIGDITLGPVIRAAGHAEVRRASHPRHDASFLVTCTTSHRRSLDHNDFALPIDGIAPVAWVGGLRRGRFVDALVERIPSGARPAPELGLFDDDALVRLGYGLASVLDAAHAANLVVQGVRPELVYVDGQRRFVALAPHGPRFIAASTEKDVIYALPCLAPEVVGGQLPSQASDVFGFCATLVVLATGRHPLGPIHAVSMSNNGVRHPWARSGRLGDLVNRGLSRDPEQRPTIRELAEELRARVGEAHADLATSSTNLDGGLRATVPAGSSPHTFESLSEAEAAAEAGDPEAQTFAAAAYLSGISVPADSAKALRWFIAAAEQGHPAAQNDLAMLFGEGVVVRRDDAQAFFWFKAAAEQGLVIACINLASCYTEGRGTSVDLTQRVHWLTLAAHAGHPEAQNELGVSYLRGLGIEQDATLAAAWFLRSAEQGHPHGEYNLACCFDTGEGVEADPAEAARWYAAAATQAFPPAMNNLGLVLEAGRGMPANPERAYVFFRGAAAQAFPPAEFNVARCYEGGIGTTQNISEAILWYYQASRSGHAAAIESLVRLQGIDPEATDHADELDQSR